MKKNVKFYFLSSLLIVVVFTITVELSTRSISFFSGKGFFLSVDELDPFDSKVESTYKWHPFTGFTFEPNTGILSGHPNQKEKSTLYINRHGFLDNDNSLRYDKAPHEIRIATIGGSTTAGLNLNHFENWPGIIEHKLKIKYPEKKIRVINAGTPGFDTSQSIGNLALRVMPFNPDIVIIYHAYNDLKAVTKNKEFTPDYSHIHDTPYGFHQKPPFYILLLNQSMLYVRTRNTYREYAKVKSDSLKYSNANRIGTIPPIALATFKEHIRSLVAIAQAGDAKVILSSFATLHNPEISYQVQDNTKQLTKLQFHELLSLMHFLPGLSLDAMFSGITSYNQILEEVSQEMKTGWVDNASIIPHEDKFFVDRVHFSNEGARKMGENLTGEVIKILELK